MTVPDQELNYSLCEFVGAIIGNGNLWTDDSRFRVELTGDPKFDGEYFNYLSNISNDLFSKRPYPLRVHGRGLRWRLQSKKAFIVLQTLGIPVGQGKSYKVTIPDLILRMGWAFSRWTLRGIMDTDGTVFFSKKTYRYPIYPTLEIRTCSEALAKQINEMLNQNSFRARLRGNKQEGYHVALYGNRMLDLWIKEIGFSNSKHLNKI